MAVGSYSETSRLRLLVFSLLVLVSAVALAIYPLQHPPPSLPGYTTSLALILLPLMALFVWFLRHRKRLSLQGKALGLTALLVFPLWVALDILLAHRLFCFPSADATIGWNLLGYVPATTSCRASPPAGWGFNIPVEELVFYLGSCLVLVLLYIWSSEEWFEAYSTQEQRLESAEGNIPRAVQLHWGLLVLGSLLLGVVWVYKRWVSPWNTGFPLYSFILIAFALVPNILFYNALGQFINERALLFTMTVAVLVSLIWEVTLALPNGWWDYQRDQMMGLTITPWSDLPIEAAVLWVFAGWGNVILYEFFRFKLHTRRSFMRALFGS